MRLFIRERPALAVGTKVFLLLFLTCGLSTSGDSQVYRNQPFDPAAKVLPRAYYGYDPAAFVEEARNVAAQAAKAQTKGEFETTAQYRERLSKLDSTNPYATNVYAFGLRPTNVSYDADKQTFTFRLRPAEAQGNANYLSATLQTVVKDAGKQEEENGFGAVVTVQKSSVSVYKLWLVKGQGLPVCTATSVVAPAEAKAMDPDIRALVVIKPTPPYDAEDVRYSEATFSDPNETRTVTDTIFGRLVGVSFYVWTTGRVLASCP